MAGDGAAEAGGGGISDQAQVLETINVLAGCQQNGFKIIAKMLEKNQCLESSRAEGKGQAKELRRSLEQALGAQGAAADKVEELEARLRDEQDRGRKRLERLAESSAAQAEAEADAKQEKKRCEALERDLATARASLVRSEEERGELQRRRLAALEAALHESEGLAAEEKAQAEGLALELAKV